MTKSFSSLMMELLLEVLGKSTWGMTVWMIRGCKGVGDIPGIQGDSGGLQVLHKGTRLSQELRLKV